MKEIKRHIKEKSFARVYLLTGDEPYLILQAKHMLKNAMVPEGDEMNYASFADDKVDLYTLRDLALTYPLFNEKRCILLDGTGILEKGKEEFVKILQEMPDTTCIVICEPKVDKRTKAYQWIKKNGYIGEFLKKKQTERTLVKWIAALLGKEKKQIRETDAKYFLQKIGNDMFQIKNETEKLIAYVGEKTEITTEDIDHIISDELQDKIFALVEAIAKGNRAFAMDCYNDLLLLKEPPMHILFLMARQYRILLIVDSMLRLHKPRAAIAKTAGIPVFAVQKNEEQLRGYGESSLELCLESCIQAEEEIKTGKVNDQIALEMLIIHLVSMEK